MNGDRDHAAVATEIIDRRLYMVIGTGQGVYVLGVARELPAHEAVEGIEIFSKRSAGHGGVEWTIEDVSPPARHRLYQATAEAHYVLDEHDHRVEVTLP